MTHPASFHPGPPDPTPEQRLLLLDDDGWESFIEDCAHQLMIEGQYVHVQLLGGAGDKGRDICGYTEATPDEDTWDLYQAKCYAKPLAPSEFAPELAKFLTHVHAKSYSRPRHYFICAIRGIGVKLFDLINDANQLRSWLLETWKGNKGNFGSFNQVLSSELETFVTSFPFEIIKNKTPADLLEMHSRNATKHWEKFGVIAPRGPNPEIPPAPSIDEQRYVEALLQVYTERGGKPVPDPTNIPAALRKHFQAQRRLFYSAEGLNRFSRDKLPGAFDDLLQQVETGIGSVVSAPYTNGMERLTVTLQVANTLRIGTNPLKSRIRAGDVPGSCHHLANQDRVNWVDDDDKNATDT